MYHHSFLPRWAGRMVLREKPYTWIPTNGASEAAIGQCGACAAKAAETAPIMAPILPKLQVRLCGAHVCVGV